MKDELFLNNKVVTGLINSIESNGADLVFDETPLTIQSKAIGTDCMMKLANDSSTMIDLTKDYRTFVCNALVPSMRGIQRNINCSASSVSKNIKTNNKSNAGNSVGATVSASKINEYMCLYNLSKEEATEVYKIVFSLKLEEKFTKEELECLIKYYPELLRKLYRASMAASYSTAEINKVYAEIRSLFKAADSITDDNVREFAFEHSLTIEQMNYVGNIENVKNHDGYKYDEKIKDMQYMAIALYGEEYQPAFVAGVLGNIYGEGDIGQLEKITEADNSKQYKRNIKSVSITLDGKTYTYVNDFSNKKIYDVNYEALKLLAEKDKEEYKAEPHVFGLGTIQWTTTDRFYRLLDCYDEADQLRDNNGQLSYEECIIGEANCIVKELDDKNNYGQNYYHRLVVDKWYGEYCDKDENDEYIIRPDTNSEESVKEATRIVFTYYEGQTDDTLSKRQTAACDFYDAMIGE